MNTPFKNLHSLVFEGESLSVQLAKFLFKSAIKYLETINLAVEEYTPEFKGKFYYYHIFRNSFRHDYKMERELIELSFN